MVFSSSIFVFIFLPLTLSVYYMIYCAFGIFRGSLSMKMTLRTRTNACNFWLLFASFVFYSWGEPVYIVLMVASIIINYFAGRLIERARKRNAAGIVLTVFIAVDVLILVVFKYLGFIVGNFITIFHLNVIVPEIALPIGISFYTFQEMSYLIDLYRKKIPVQKNILHLALYVAMFPQLIAGPIVRYIDIEKELLERNVTLHGISKGISRFSTGLVKKVLVADRISVLADLAFSMNTSGEVPLTMSWLGMLAYTLQIYFDFSGYSDMAIGLGEMMGFHFNENFNLPYCSTSVKEFWRRWHISLSTWFRDYVYIPLGGSRCSCLRADINLLIVFILTGFWHGASWNFVVWGLYYAVFLLVERLVSRHIKIDNVKDKVVAMKLNKAFLLVRWIITTMIIAIGWIFFRAESLTAAISYIRQLVDVNNTRLLYSLSYLDREIICAIILGILFCIPYSRKIKKKIGWKVVKHTLLPIGFLIACIYVLSDTYSPFLYFRF